MFTEQQTLWPGDESVATAAPAPQLKHPGAYDRVLLAFSGGKDSMACLLQLLDMVEPSKILLLHHDVDGAGPSFMDWPVTRSYCAAVARALGVELQFSYREGGFKAEMLRNNAPTGDVILELPDGHVRLPSKKDKLGTRLKFPQLSASLSTRWCSSYLKIDVGARAIAGQECFNRGDFLFVTGERAEESSNRAKYAAVEQHRTHNQSRLVTHWRPVLDWSAHRVWDCIRSHRIRPHPAYELVGRVSCMKCIFGSPTQWATIRKIDPEGFAEIADFERRFGISIRRDGPVSACADKATPTPVSQDLRALLMGTSYPHSIRLRDDEPWSLPAAAFGEACGPT